MKKLSSYKYTVVFYIKQVIIQLYVAELSISKKVEFIEFTIHFKLKKK